MVLTAREWGWSPTAVIRGAKNPRKPHWSDYAFAYAVKTLEEEKERESNKGSAPKGTNKMVRLVPEKGFEDVPPPTRADFYKKAQAKAMAKQMAAQTM